MKIIRKGTVVYAVDSCGGIANGLNGKRETVGIVRHICKCWVCRVYKKNPIVEVSFDHTPEGWAVFEKKELRVL